MRSYRGLGFLFPRESTPHLPSENNDRGIAHMSHVGFASLNGPSEFFRRTSNLPPRISRKTRIGKRLGQKRQRQKLPRMHTDDTDKT